MKKLEFRKLIREEIKKVLKEATEQVYGLRLGAAKMYGFDFGELVDEANEYNFSKFDGGEDGEGGADYSWNFERGDDFPESITIKNPAMLNDPKVKDFLFDQLGVKKV